MTLESFTCAAIVAGIFLLFRTWYPPEATVARRLYSLVLTVLVTRYVVWRWQQTLPIFAWSGEAVFGYGFFFLELLSQILFVRSRRVLSSTLNRSKQADANMGWHERLPRPPLIDVFVPSYNEGWEVLEKTFVGLGILRYPRLRVWILDDSRREWLRVATERAGFNYLKRPDNTHFKAGNLNHALTHVMALAEAPDFIAVFDADFVAQPNFLERTLALMADEKVGIVQTPQTFYNPDPFQFGLRARETWPDEQRFLFDIRMPSADAKGGAQCCGTSFLLRVKALSAIGGRFPVDTICEDTMTSIKLKEKGWQTVYLMERLSAGLNAEGLEEFLKQRSRWCLGGVQIAQAGYRSARSRMAKVYALEAMLKWGFQSFMQMLWLTLPIFFWLTGFSLLHANASEIVEYIFPMALARSYVAWLTRHTQMSPITDSMTLMLAPTAIRATLMGLMPHRQHVFRVTNKGLARSGTVVHWRVMLFTGGALLLLVGGMVYRSLITPLASSGSYTLWNYYVACQQIVVLLAVLLVAIERPRHRQNDRYATAEQVILECAPLRTQASIVDLSLSGVRVRCATSLKIGQAVTVTLADVGEVLGTVVRVPAPGDYGIRFDTACRRTELIRKIYCSKLCIPEMSWRALPSVAAIFRGGGNLLLSGLRWLLPVGMPVALQPAESD